jgi:hypothetical protein
MSINIAYSFVGVLPEYILDTVHQSRLFFSGNIYLIVSDLCSPYISVLKEKYGVIIIPHFEIMNHSFFSLVDGNFSKFHILPGLKTRAELFVRSLERFFLIKNAMEKYNIENCFFMELDNLIYDEPTKWLSQFSKNELCYMFDNDDRCSSGIMYIKSYQSLEELLDYIFEFVKSYKEDDNNKHWLSEMIILYKYFQKVQNSSTVQLLPIFWKEEPDPLANANFSQYQDTIFDAAALGIMLFGFDPSTNPNGEIIKGKASNFSKINYTLYETKFEMNENGLKIPYIFTGEKWLKINNLHIHSKNLYEALSKERDTL